MGQKATEKLQHQTLLKLYFNLHTIVNELITFLRVNNHHINFVKAFDITTAAHSSYQLTIKNQIL